MTLKQFKKIISKVFRGSRNGNVGGGGVKIEDRRKKRQIIHSTYNAATLIKV